jgi:hypothetical protein
LSGDKLCFYSGSPPDSIGPPVACASNTTVHPPDQISATTPALAIGSAHSVEYYLGIERCCNGLSNLEYPSSIPYVFSQPWILGVPSTRVLVNPQVAFVLVGDWWCPLYGSNPPKGICSTGTAGQDRSMQASFLSTATSLIQHDYSGAYDSALANYFQKTYIGSACTTSYVGAGITLRTLSNGQTWAGPVEPKAVPLEKLSSQFGMTSSGITNTVFVLLYVPGGADSGPTQRRAKENHHPPEESLATSPIPPLRPKSHRFCPDPYKLHRDLNTVVRFFRARVAHSTATSSREQPLRALRAARLSVGVDPLV